MLPSYLPTVLNSSSIATVHTILKLLRQCLILRVNPKYILLSIRDTEEKDGPRAEWSVLSRQLFRSLFWPLHFPWHKVSLSIPLARYCCPSSSCHGPNLSSYTRMWTVVCFWKKSASIFITTRNTKEHETYQIWKSLQTCACSCWWWPIIWMVPILLTVRWITANIAR